MGEFTLRDKLESWIEGILDIVEVYFQTMYYLHLKPRESVKYLDPYRKKGFYYSEEYDKVGTKVKFSRPGFYMILSYFFMLFLIKDIDFTETLPTFFLNFVDILGAINAAKSMRVEEIIINIFPAIGLLMFYVYLTEGLFRLVDVEIDRGMIRRNYSYMLGGYFLTIGFTLWFNQNIVIPLSAVPFVNPYGNIIPLCFSFGGIMTPYGTLLYSGGEPKWWLIIILNLLALMLPIILLGIFINVI